MITYTFELTRKTTKAGRKDNELISANDRFHHHYKAKLTRHLRELGSNVEPIDEPFSQHKPCYVVVDVQPPTNRRMDAPNWYPTVKAIIDGFVDNGILLDDNNNVITETRFKSTKLSGIDKYIFIISLVEVDNA